MSNVLDAFDTTPKREERDYDDSPTLGLICNVGKSLSAMLGGKDKTEFISLWSEMPNGESKNRLVWVNKTKKGSSIIFLTRVSILHLVALWNKKYPEAAIHISDSK